MAEVHRVTCPHCGKAYGVSDDKWPSYQGREISCTQCGKAFLVSDAPAMSPPTPPAAPTVYGPPSVMPAPGTNGIAIAALVLGLLSFCVPLFLSIPAIVLGAIGMSKTSGGRAGGRGFAIAGLTMGIISCIMMPCMISILLPALNKARGAANQVKCAANLRQIGVALVQYANSQQDGAFPNSLDALVNSGTSLSPGDFVCPSSTDTPPSSAGPQAMISDLNSGGHLSYVYLGNGMSSKVPGVGVLMYELPSNHHNGGHVLFSDGHVRFIPLAREEAAIQQLKAGQNPPPALIGQ